MGLPESKMRNCAEMLITIASGLTHRLQWGTAQGIQANFGSFRVEQPRVSRREPGSAGWRRKAFKPLLGVVFLWSDESCGHFDRIRRGTRAGLARAG